MARTAAKVANKAAKKVNGVSKSPAALEAERRLINLAEQVGWFAGTVQGKADDLMDNETLKQQMTLIRDGASTVLDQLSRAGAAASESAMKLAKTAKAAMPGVTATLAEVERKAAAEAKRAQSRALVAAPGKTHRKPPPQERIDRRMGELRGAQAGQKQFRVGKSRGRG